MRALRRWRAARACSGHEPALTTGHGKPPVRGAEAEELACRHLQKEGLLLVERNYRCQRGEIDLIMRDGASMVFVEVRYRRSVRFGSGAESIDRRKQAKLAAAALHYLQSHRNAAKCPARFDVVSIAPDVSGSRIDWIKNAFEA
ncbi:MAG: YraN family protein [Gammaproteobacteria bacterium]|nr:YraN family protein [Gammaproteobacteria bacterium]